MDESLRRSREWLDFAKMDMASAQYLTGMRPQPLEIICYHCQQAVEKALKGYLILCGRESPKIHDLARLCELCASIDPTFTDLGQSCARLTPYGVQVRYPAHLELTEEDMTISLEDCENALAFITEAMHMDARPDQEEEEFSGPRMK